MDGLLLIDKPRGMTSHDVVARARRITGMRAIGHAGTLDPFATGLLILCLGHGTRLSEYLIGEIKTYIGTIKLGERTNTDDLEGEVQESRPVNVTAEVLERARLSFVGEISQVPPQYSAIQIGGRRAYKMARQGEVVDLAPRRVRILDLTLTLVPDDPRPATDSEGQMPLPGASPLIGNRQSSLRQAQGGPFVNLRVTCTAGTYIRALARDLGELLGCGAHLAALRRVRSGPFSLDDAVTLEQLLPPVPGDEWRKHVLPMDRAVPQFPECRLDAQAAQHFLMGQSAHLPSSVVLGEPGLCRVYEPAGRLIAIGEYDRAACTVKPVKVFHPGQ
jgi:tRNA pseudouridine55 synthase